MSRETDWATFWKLLPGWLARSLVCAVPSGFIAVASEYRHYAEICGVVTGVMIWAMTMSYATTRWTETRSPCGFVWLQEFRMATWIHIGLICAGAALLMFDAKHGLSGLWTWLLVPILLPLLAELLTGAFAVMVVELLGELIGQNASSSANSAGWTLLTTLIQGAAVISAIALLVYGMRLVRYLVFKSRAHAVAA